MTLARGLLRQPVVHQPECSSPHCALSRPAEPTALVPRYATRTACATSAGSGKAPLVGRTPRLRSRACPARGRSRRPAHWSSGRWSTSLRPLAPPCPPCHRQARAWQGRARLLGHRDGPRGPSAKPSTLRPARPIPPRACAHARERAHASVSWELFIPSALSGEGIRQGCSQTSVNKSETPPQRVFWASGSAPASEKRHVIDGPCRPPRISI